MSGITRHQFQRAISERALYVQTQILLDGERLQQDQESGKEIVMSEYISHKSIIASSTIADYVDITLEDGSIFRPEPGKNYLLMTDNFDKEG